MPKAVCVIIASLVCLTAMPSTSSAAATSEAAVMAPPPPQLSRSYLVDAAPSQTNPRLNKGRMRSVSNQRAYRDCQANQRVDTITGASMECIAEADRVDGCHADVPPLKLGSGFCDVHMRFIIEQSPGDPGTYIWRCWTAMWYRQVGNTMRRYSYAWACAKENP